MEKCLWVGSGVERGIKGVDNVSTRMSLLELYHYFDVMLCINLLLTIATGLTPLHSECQYLCSVNSK